jgi:nicotinate-nucleotide adenylyltransferase
MNTILIYGGSFDPPHLGHLHTALNIQAHFHFQQFIFVPCKTPALKNATKACSKQRVELLELMLQPFPKFTISQVELLRDTPSYMSETLLSFRRLFGEDASITLLLGMDAFENFLQWHEYQTIPDLCNVLVMQRPEPEKRRLSQPDSLFQISDEALEILHHTNGHLAYFNAGLYPISSTEIRNKLKHNQNIDHMLASSVADYIKLYGLYL